MPTRIYNEVSGEHIEFESKGVWKNRWGIATTYEDALRDLADGKPFIGIFCNGPRGDNPVNSSIYDSNGFVRFKEVGLDFDDIKARFRSVLGEPVNTEAREQMRQSLERDKAERLAAEKAEQEERLAKLREMSGIEIEEDGAWA